MKKYIFAVLTFVVGFFITVLIQTFVISGILIQCLLYGSLFGLTAYVYRKFKSKEPQLTDENNPNQLTNTEIESFEKTLGKLNYEEFGIEEILVGYGKNKNVNYCIIIRTKGGLFNHMDVVRKSLGKQFYFNVNFEIFLNSRNEELENLMSAVYRIKRS